MSETHMMDFCELYNLKNLIKEPTTCYRNAINPSSINPMLTNRIDSFCSSMAIETGLSDCHKMNVTVLKKCYMKKEPRMIKYRRYKNYNGDIFKLDLLNNFKMLDEESLNYDKFLGDR